MPVAAPPILPTADARTILAATRGDAELHAGVALLLLVGLRPGEVVPAGRRLGAGRGAAAGGRQQAGVTAGVHDLRKGPTIIAFHELTHH